MLGGKFVEANFVTGDDTFYFAETWMSQSNGNLMVPSSMPSPPKRSSRDYSLPRSLNLAWLVAGRKFPGGWHCGGPRIPMIIIFGSLDHSALVMSR